MINSGKASQKVGASALTQEAVLRYLLAIVVDPSGEKRVCICFLVPMICVLKFEHDPISIDEDTHSFMYASVGKSGGSHPMLMLSGSW